MDARHRARGEMRAALLLLLCGWWAAPALALDGPHRTAMVDAAQQASRSCLHQMHHDTDEFSTCVDARLASATRPEERLGVAYLGLVGCLSAGRIATLHADTCARAYLVGVDRWRGALALTDQELCPVVAGNCASRVAQIEALRQTMRREADRARK